MILAKFGWIASNVIISSGKTPFQLHSEGAYLTKNISNLPIRIQKHSISQGIKDLLANLGRRRAPFLANRQGLLSAGTSEGDTEALKVDEHGGIPKSMSQCYTGGRWFWLHFLTLFWSDKLIPSIAHIKKGLNKAHFRSLVHWFLFALQNCCVCVGLAAQKKPLQKKHMFVFRLVTYISSKKSYEFSRAHHHHQRDRMFSLGFPAMTVSRVTGPPASDEGIQDQNVGFREGSRQQWCKNSPSFWYASGLQRTLVAVHLQKYSHATRELGFWLIGYTMTFAKGANKSNSN